MSQTSYLQKAKDPTSKRSYKPRRSAEDWVPDPIQSPRGFWAANGSRLLLWFCVLFGITSVFLSSLIAGSSGPKDGAGMGVFFVFNLVAWLTLPFYPWKLYKDHKLLKTLGTDPHSEQIAQQKFKHLSHSIDTLESEE